MRYAVVLDDKNQDNNPWLYKIDGKSILERMIECLNVAHVDKIYFISDNIVDNDFFINYSNFQVLKKSGFLLNKLQIFSNVDELLIINKCCFIFSKQFVNDFICKCNFDKSDMWVVTSKNNTNDCLLSFIKSKILENNINLMDSNFFRGLMLDSYEKKLCSIYKGKSVIYSVTNMKSFVSARKKFYSNINKNLLSKGIEIINPDTTYIGEDVIVGKNVIIYPNNYIFGKTIIGDNSIIFSNCYIEDSIIGKECNIGPYSHLKKGSKLGESCIVGAFVEVKNSKIENNVKAKHHAYLGDVEIDDNCNIGCGVIFANYDGKKKNKSHVGCNSFIGSNVTIVSPVNIGNNAVVGAGSTIVKDVNDYDLAIAREYQVNKENYYRQYNEL